MNKVMLMGRLTRDPEIRYSQGANSIAVTRFNVAVDRRFRKEGDQEADFLNIVAFGKLGEFAEKFFKKGLKVVVVGRLQTGRYEKEGVTHYTTDVIAEELHFAESKKSFEGNQEAGFSQAPRPQTKMPEDNGFAPIGDDFDDDDIPF